MQAVFGHHGLKRALHKDPCLWHFGIVLHRFEERGNLVAGEFRGEQEPPKTLAGKCTYGLRIKDVHAKRPKKTDLRRKSGYRGSGARVIGHAGLKADGYKTGKKSPERRHPGLAGDTGQFPDQMTVLLPAYREGCTEGSFRPDQPFFVGFLVTTQKTGRFKTDGSDAGTCSGLNCFERICKEDNPAGVPPAAPRQGNRNIPQPGTVLVKPMLRSPDIGRGRA